MPTSRSSGSARTTSCSDDRAGEQSVLVDEEDVVDAAVAEAAQALAPRRGACASGRKVVTRGSISAPAALARPGGERAQLLGQARVERGEQARLALLGVEPGQQGAPRGSD